MTKKTHWFKIIPQGSSYDYISITLTISKKQSLESETIEAMRLAHEFVKTNLWPDPYSAMPVKAPPDKWFEQHIKIIRQEIRAMLKRKSEVIRWLRKEQTKNKD